MTSSGWIRAADIKQGDTIRIDRTGLWLRFEAWDVEHPHYLYGDTNSTPYYRAHVTILTNGRRWTTGTIGMDEMIEIA